MTNIDEIITKVESRFCDLDHGDHMTTERGCIMELVSWAAGEPWTDFPQCVSRGVALHCQRIHDNANPSEYASIWTRDRLAGVLSLPHGEDAMRRRAYIAAEHARASAVRCLRSREIDTSAIDACATVTSRETATALRDAISAAYADAYAAAADADAAADAAADADAAANAAAYAAYAAADAADAAYAAADAAAAAAYAAYAAATAAAYAADAYAAYAAATVAAAVRQHARIKILDLWIEDARRNA